MEKETTSLDDLMDSFEKRDTPVMRVFWFFRYLPWRIQDKWFDLRQAWLRAYRGYDDAVLWSLHSCITHDVLKGLDYMIEKGHGYPGHPDQTAESWNGILKQIREGFLAAKRVDEGTNYDSWHEIRSKMGRQWVRDNKEEYDLKFQECYKKDQEDIALFKRAVPLFGEWYFNLWD